MPQHSCISENRFDLYDLRGDAAGLSLDKLDAGIELEV